MKMLSRFLPGVLLSAAVFAVVGYLHAQANATAPAPVQVVQAPPPVQYVQAPAVAPIPARVDPHAVTLCGSCGSQLAAPQVVQVAAPIYGQPLTYFSPGAVRGRGGYVVECEPYIPPAPIFAGFPNERRYYGGRGCTMNHHHGHGCR